MHEQLTKHTPHAHAQSDWMLDPCKAVVPLQDKQEVEDDDLDAILAELDGKPPPAQHSGATGTAAGAAPAEEAMTTEPADASEATGVRFFVMT